MPTNRKRVSRNRKPQPDESEYIFSLATDWTKAANAGNTKKANQIRTKADPIFKKHPDWLSNPPWTLLSLQNSDLYLAWQSFVGFNHREELIAPFTEYQSAIRAGDVKLAGQCADTAQELFLKYTGDGLPLNPPPYYGLGSFNADWARMAQKQWSKPGK